MAKYTIEDTTLTNIANAIRTKSNTTETLKPTDMPNAINAIETTTVVNEEGILDAVANTPSGTSFIETDIAPGPTDEYVVETRIAWNRINKRQLMGADFEATYWGINASGHPEIAGTPDSNTTIEEHKFYTFKAVFLPTVRQLYVDGNLVVSIGNGNRAGGYKHQLFALRGGFNCECAIAYQKVWINGELVAHYVAAKPATANSVTACFYDKVSNTYLTDIKKSDGTTGTLSFTKNNAYYRLTYVGLLQEDKICFI